MASVQTHLLKPELGKKAGNVRYHVVYRDPTGKQRRKSFRRKDDAVRYARSVEVDIDRGDYVDPAHGRESFRAWWERYWATTSNLRPSTRARDQSYAKNHVLPTFGSMPLAGIDHLTVSAWVADLTSAGLAPATVHKCAQVLSKALREAVDGGLIKSNPAEKVRLPTIERQEMMFLTVDQVAALAAAMDDRYRALVLLGAYGGLRLGEMTGLRVGRVDLPNRRVDVQEILVEVRGEITTGPPKTRAGHRSVPIPRIVADALLDHVDGRGADELVFTSPHGAPMRASLFRRRFFQPAAVKAGLGVMVRDDDTGRTRYEGLRIHDLRHTAVALWIAAGASPSEIKRRAGHTSTSVVLDRYGHLLPGSEDAVTDALDQMACDTGVTSPEVPHLRAVP